MLYYYSLDSNGRVNHITSKVVSYYKTIELTDEQFKSIRIGITGIVNNKLVYIGKTQEEINQDMLQNNISRILELKQLLEDTDWKVIVNAELIQAGLPPKYPELHQERQAWRDEINALEV